MLCIAKTTERVQIFVLGFIFLSIKTDLVGHFLSKKKNLEISQGFG